MLRTASIIFLLALSCGPAGAQGNEGVVREAISVWSHIELTSARLGICADFDVQNAPTYLLISGEYLRDKAVHEAIVNTDKVIDTEMRLLTGANFDKAKAAQKQGLEMVVQQIRKQSQDAPNEFTLTCRALAQNFLLREGPFRPLKAIFPKETSDIELWIIINRWSGPKYR